MVPNTFALDVLIDLFFFALESIPKNFESLFFASFPSVLKTEGFSLFLVAIIFNKISLSKFLVSYLAKPSPPQNHFMTTL